MRKTPFAGGHIAAVLHLHRSGRFAMFRLATGFAERRVHEDVPQNAEG
jgi:hypothetical protein